MFKKIFTRKEKVKEKDDSDEEGKKNEINIIKEEGNENGEVQKPIQQTQQKKEAIIELKKGDYNVHILIEEVKNLISLDDEPPVPRVKMTVFGKEQRTSKMKKPCDNFVFNEHFYFNKTNLTAEMLDSEKVIIEVYDNKHTKKKDYFGIYEFDFSYIYGRNEHALKNFWIGLSNTESEDMTKIRGYLKLSISILNENDNRVELKPKDSDLGDCIIPIEIKMKYKQISFYFFKGEPYILIYLKSLYFPAYISLILNS